MLKTIKSSYFGWVVAEVEDRGLRYRFGKPDCDGSRGLIRNGVSVFSPANHYASLTIPTRVGRTAASSASFNGSPDHPHTRGKGVPDVRYLSFRKH